jgi:hypothetical protein
MATTDSVFFVCFGDAKPTDMHLLADIRATSDAELVSYVERRQRWRFWYRLGDCIAWWTEGVLDRFH